MWILYGWYFAEKHWSTVNDGPRLSHSGFCDVGFYQSCILHLKKTSFQRNTFCEKPKGLYKIRLNRSLWKFSTNFQFAHRRHPPFQHFWSSRECFARKTGLLPLMSRVPPTPGFSDAGGVQIQNDFIQRWYMVKYQESAIPITDACFFHFSEVL